MYEDDEFRTILLVKTNKRESEAQQAVGERLIDLSLAKRNWTYLKNWSMRWSLNNYWSAMNAQRITNVKSNYISAN